MELVVWVAYFSPEYSSLLRYKAKVIIKGSYLQLN